MNTLVIVLIAAVCLLAGYVFYGRWLAKKWGIDPKAKTPAYTHEDGEDYVPTDGWTVFAHQFSSIAGAGPVTGAIQAAAFGWLPVLLWILLGGIFFGAVTDFGALYASVKNEGKSMGMLIEQYIGKTGRKLFLLFCWLFTLIVTAAFADMVSGTFNGFVTDAATGEITKSFHYVYRLRCCLWSDSEKDEVYWLERGCSWTGMHGCLLCTWYQLPNCCYKRNLELCYIRIYLLCCYPSNVAFDAA